MKNTKGHVDIYSLPNFRISNNTCACVKRIPQIDCTKTDLSAAMHTLAQNIFVQELIILFF